MGQQSTPAAKKTLFFKNDPGPHGMPKQVFMARFELVMARFGAPKILKCHVLGPNMTEKCVFQKMILDHLECTNK